MKSLVIGANGFLGSHLVDALLKEGHEIRVLDKSNSNLISLNDKIEFITGDFLNYNDLSQSISDIDYVFNMVSFSTPSSSFDNPRLDQDTSVQGMLTLLDLCVKNNVKKIFFPSSGGTVYGDTNKENFSEEDPTNPICPYAISKINIEKYLDYYNKLHGLPYLIFRISNPYGERQKLNKGQGVIPNFINLIKNNRPVTIFGDGENIRDYIYVTEVTELIARVITTEHKNNIYNVGSGQGYSIHELINILKTFCNRDFETIYEPARKSDVYRSVLDISRIKNEFNFESKISLFEGIKKIW